MNTYKCKAWTHKHERCGLRAIKDGYCNQHHPNTVKIKEFNQFYINGKPITYTLTVFDKNHQQIHRIPGLALERAKSLAETLRPVLGSSYITLDNSIGSELNFKPYRSTWPKNFSYPGTRRPKPEAIKALALRLKKDWHESSIDHINNVNALLALANNQNHETP